MSNTVLLNYKSIMERWRICEYCSKIEQLDPIVKHVVTDLIEGKSAIQMNKAPLNYEEMKQQDPNFEE